jgi:hypothetical protein
MRAREVPAQRVFEGFVTRNSKARRYTLGAEGWLIAGRSCMSARYVLALNGAADEGRGGRLPAVGA